MWLRARCGWCSVEQRCEMNEKRLRQIGWGVSIFAAVGLVMSGVMKFVQPPEMVAQMTKVGIPMTQVTTYAIIEIIAAALYIIPRTAIVGMGLVIAYLGGAVFAHVRADDAFMAPIMIGLMAATGLALRSERVRSLVLQGT
jgi:hypothetical protein